MNSHFALKTSDNCVAYMDVGQVREQGAVSSEDLANSLLLAAIFALFSNVLSTTCFAQT